MRTRTCGQPCLWLTLCLFLVGIHRTSKALDEVAQHASSPRSQSSLTSNGAVATLCRLLRNCLHHVTHGPQQDRHVIYQLLAQCAHVTSLVCRNNESRMHLSADPSHVNLLADVVESQWQALSVGALQQQHDTDSAAAAIESCIGLVGTLSPANAVNMIRVDELMPLLVGLACCSSLQGVRNGAAPEALGTVSSVPVRIAYAAASALVNMAGFLDWAQLLRRHQVVQMCASAIEGHQPGDEASMQVRTPPSMHCVNAPFRVCKQCGSM